MILLCATLVYGAEKKPDGKAILIDVRLSSEVNGNIIKMLPKVLTVEGKAAKITVGNKKAQLNDKDVTSGAGEKEGKNFLTILEVTPTFMGSANPEVIKLDMKFYLNHNNCVLNEEFQTVIAGNDPFRWSYTDPVKKQKVELIVNASVSQEKQDKVKVDVETK